jgi:hypothetical protein
VVCAEARRTWDDRYKRFEVGEGPARIRVSTRNGPVSVRSARPGDGDPEED